jgi:hypothetical protein
MPKIKLVRGLPLKQLLEQIYYHARNGEASRRALAFYLKDLSDRKDGDEVGISRAVDFADCKVGMPARETRELIRTARKLEELRLIDAAFDEGKISWSKVRAIVRVAKPEHEEKWLKFARTHLAREVESAVAEAREGEAPPKGGGGGVTRSRSRLGYDVSRLTKRVFETALLKALEMCGDGTKVEAALKLIAEKFLALVPESEASNSEANSEADSEASEDAGSCKTVYTVVVHTTQEGREAWIDADGSKAAVTPEELAEAARKGEVIEAEDLRDPGDREAIRFGERGTVAPEDRDPATTAAQRRAVLARDDFRCLECRRKQRLNVHHIESRANGGKTSVKYLCCVCGSCHGLCHEHLLVLCVDEDGKLIALDSDGNPLLEEDGVAGALAKLAANLRSSPQSTAPCLRTVSSR